MRGLTIGLTFILALLGTSYYYFYKTSQVTNTEINIELSSSEVVRQEKPLAKETVSPISISYLRELDIQSPKYEVVEKLPSGSNYDRYLVYYLSEGEKVYSLLTVPKEPAPEGGFPAIIFNHGYIPPKNYSTTGNYASYVDYLAKNGFVVFKIDMRGHGQSEGLATGTYFSSTYTIDVISALRSLQKSDLVNPSRIGVWGHSMSGNLVLRSMLVSNEIKAGVIWAGGVYSYQDFGKYRISDSSFIQRPMQQIVEHKNRDTSSEIQKLRENYQEVDFTSDYWKSISLTQNLDYLSRPLQLHHSTNDDVVNIGYSRDLVKVLKENSKDHEYFEYSGGGHNITGIYFDQAMQRTVEFFKKNL